MVYFLDESGHRKFSYLLADGPVFPLVEATQALFHQLGAWWIFKACSVTSLEMPGMFEGFYAKMSVGVEEADERAFLFRGKHGANVHHVALRAAGVYEDLLGALHWLERPSRRLGSGASSVTSFLMTASSLEATIVVA